MSDTDRRAGELSSRLHLAADNARVSLHGFRSFDVLILHTTANGNRASFDLCRTISPSQGIDNREMVSLPSLSHLVEK